MQAVRFSMVCCALALVAAGPLFAQQAKPALDSLTPGQKLIRTVPGVNLAQVPLMRVLDQYAQVSGLAIKPEWGALESAGITKETPVTLRTTPMRFSRLLDLTLNSVAPRNRPLAWSLSGSEVIVSTQMRVLLRDRAALIDFAPARGKAIEEETPQAGGGVRKFDFKETPLNLVMDFFRELSGVNFHVNWRALEATGVTKETPVTLKVEGVSVGRALDLVLDQLNVGRDRYSSVYWIIDEGVVQVATGESFNAQTRVRVYDISDLLMVVPNFEGPRIDLSNIGNNTGTNNTGTGGTGLFGNNTTSNNGGSNAGGEGDVAAQREAIRTTLIEIIKSSIGDDMWAPTGKGSIRILQNRLIVSQTPLGFKLMEQSLGR